MGSLRLPHALLNRIVQLVKTISQFNAVEIKFKALGNGWITGANFCQRCL
jgi:hypothetical protein